MNTANRLQWGLATSMAKAGLMKATELHRALADAGYDISSAQVTRLMKSRPEQLKLDLLEALMDVLACPLDHLLISEKAPITAPSPTSPVLHPPHKAPSPIKPRLAKKTIASAEIDVGPTVTPFPIKRK